MQGSDGTNSRFMAVDLSGRELVVGAVAAGSAPAGNPLYIGASVTTSAPTYTTATVNALSLDTSGNLRVTGAAGTFPVTGTVTANQGTANTAANAWPTLVTDGTNTLGVTAHPFVVTGSGTAGTAATGVVTIQGIAGGTVVPVSGTVTVNAGTGNFNNASVGSPAAAPPSSATYVGALVGTTAPSLTNGQMDPLSLTTAGALRVDGYAGTFPVIAIVSSSSPTYISGQENSLSLTTAGALRVDGSAVTQPVSGTVTANAGTGNYNNSSVGSTAAAPPSSATYVGALVGKVLHH